MIVLVWVFFHFQGLVERIYFFLNKFFFYLSIIFFYAFILSKIAQKRSVLISDKFKITLGDSIFNTGGEP
jgi:hypothetical protein